MLTLHAADELPNTGDLKLSVSLKEMGFSHALFLEVTGIRNCRRRNTLHLRGNKAKPPSLEAQITKNGNANTNYLIVGVATTCVPEGRRPNSDNVFARAGRKVFRDIQKQSVGTTVPW